MKLRNFLVAGALLAGVLFYSGCVTNNQTAGGAVQRLVFTGVKSEKKFVVEGFESRPAIRLVWLQLSGD